MPRKRGALLDKLLNKYPNHPLLAKLIQELEKYYEMQSIDNTTNINKIFSALYLKRRKSIEVAEDNYIHQTTVCTYVDKYSELAKKLILRNYIAGLKEAFASEINF